MHLTKLMYEFAFGNSVLWKVQMEVNSSSNGGSKPVDMLFTSARTLKYMKALMGKQFIVAFKFEHQ